MDNMVDINFIELVENKHLASKEDICFIKQNFDTLGFGSKVEKYLSFHSLLVFLSILVIQKKMMLLLVSLSILSISKTTAQNLPDTLTLDHFLALTEQYTLAQKEAQLDFQTAELSYHLFQASLKPQLSAFGTIPNFQRTFSETVQPNGTIQFQPISYNNSYASLYASKDLATTGGTIFAQSDLQRFDDFENDVTQYNGVPFRVGINQPLFAYNEWKWRKQIEPLLLEEARKKYAYDLEVEKTTASTLFFNLLLSYNELQIAISNQGSINTLFDIAKERYELGKISERDLMQLEVELASAENNRKAAMRGVQRLSTDVHVLLGSPEQRLIIPQLPNEIEILKIEEEKALKEMTVNRFEIISAQIEALQAKSDLDFAKKENGFRLDVQASAGFAGSAKALDPVYTMARNEQRFSVQFRVPILDWGQRKDAMKIAKIQQEFTRQKVQQNQLQLRAEVQQILQQFNSLQEEVQLAANIQNLASKRYEISKESYVLGAISITELTLSQREKDQTSRQYINVLSQYWQLYQLLRLNTLYDFRKEEKVLSIE